MNERIFDMARQSGATDEQGSRAEHIFCFTKSELSAFAELIVRECVAMVNGFERGVRHQGAIQNPADAIARLSVAMCEHFGVEE